MKPIQPTDTDVARTGSLLHDGSQSLGSTQGLLTPVPAQGAAALADEAEESQSLLYEGLLDRSDPYESLNELADWANEKSEVSRIGTATVGRATQSKTTPGSGLVLPDCDDQIFDFRLGVKLGEGAFARVFLALQGGLANREVVLKLSAIEGSEPQTLAQLQHTHVVPIYSVHEDALCGVRAVCMPYFGGACLSKVLKHLWGQSGLPSRGAELLKSLDRVSGPEPAVWSAQRIETDTLSGTSTTVPQSAHSSRGALAGLSYVQASVWIAARLAEGLHHAHERNVIHRDVKPSNVLISAEGQPLLLDFNVSQVLDCDMTEASVGGTIAYMAPEQLRAVITRDPDRVADITHLSDIYSLGLVLYEMLAGATPFVERSRGSGDPRQNEAVLAERERQVPSLKQRSKLPIPWSLESIVRKCLACSPLDRYATAAQLADDLNRFLADLPLKYAPELSLTERCQKWFRRHPRVTSYGTAALIGAAFLVPGAIVFKLTYNDLVVKRRELTNARALDVARNFEEGAQRALCLVNTVTSEEEMLTAGIAACRETLAPYGVLTDKHWQQSDYWQSLSKQRRQEVAHSMRELLLVYAAALLRAAPEPQAAVPQALELVQQAAEIEGLPPSRALMLDRARYLELAGRGEEARQATALAESIPTTTAHDKYMLATSYARQQTMAGYRQAVELLSQAIEQSPKHYWSYFERALCEQELGESVLAISDLGSCVGIWPESSWAHFNRGYLLARQGKTAESIHDYSTAIQHAPEFVSAFLNRGLARLEQADYAGALKDFQTVDRLGRRGAVVDAGQAMALEGLGRHQAADKLFARVLNEHAGAATDVKERLSWTYAFAVSHRAPAIAKRVFDELLKTNPKHPQALYGRGMLQMEQGQLNDAVRSFDTALSVAPQFIEPLRYRAVALARLGHFEAAAADANACVERQPNNPDSLYIAACVASIAARQLRSESLAEKGLQFLHRAIACGGDPERARSDSDLSVLHKDPRFRDLAGGEPELKDRSDATSL